MSETQAAPQGGVPLGIPTGFGPSGRAGAPPVQRVRLTFTKEAALRYIGHLDLVRMWERAFRRAKLPLAYTLGFTPHPRLTFAAPLALGATSEGELVDVYLREWMEPGEVVRRISEQLPGGCSVAGVEEIPLEGATLTAQTRWAEYVVEASAEAGSASATRALPAQGSRWARRQGAEPVPERGERDQAPLRPPAERLPPPEPDPPLPPDEQLRRGIDTLLAADALPRERVRDGKPVSYDLRPLVLSLWLAEPRAAEPTRARLGMVVRLDSSGAGRPDEICAALGLRARSVHRVRIGLEGEPARAARPT